MYHFLDRAIPVPVPIHEYFHVNSRNQMAVYFYHFVDRLVPTVPYHFRRLR